jgi:tetratricopeptide (TPR) repeat protein
MTLHWPQRVLATRWIVVAVACLLGLQVGTTPVFAQSENSMSTAQKKEMRNQIKQAYAEGAKAGKAKNFEQAATKFEEALQMAQANKEPLKLSDQLISQIQGNLLNSLKAAGSKALKQENYQKALTHYEKLMTYTDNDPSVRYNQGLALINMDSTDAGLQSLKRAIELGNETGNTRVAGLATERIRDEFLAKASKALQGDNPSDEQISTALDAIDQMQEYVDPNANAMFYRGTALYEASQFEQAIQAARQGLEMHQGSRSDAAKFHFVIAESQIGLGNKASACETFQSAAYGDYEARANHYLNNECDDL